MSPDNLTAVYNQNPTIQSMYTLPEYLSLFGQGSYTPIQPTPTDSTPTDPTPEPDIPNIINQNFNQGGGEGDGNNTIGGKDYGYNSSFASTGTTPEENLNFLDDIREGTIDDDDLTAGLSFKEGLYSLQNKFKNLPTFTNLARKGIKAFNDYQEKKAKEKEIQKEAEAQAARDNMADAAAISERLKNEFNRDSGGGFGVSGPDTSSNPTGASNRASQERGFSLHGARGGSVPRGLSRKSYFNGGIVSLRRR